MTSRPLHHPWFILPFPQPSAAQRLLCVPYAGGGASVFVPWARALGDRRIEICAVQLPGREHRLNEVPFSRLEPIVEALATAIPPLLDKPYALFGHSMGATIAFELTRELRRRQLPLPRRLFVSGAESPDVRERPEPLTGIEDDEAFVRAVASRYGGIPPAALENEELRSLILPALRGDLMVDEHYRYREGMPLPVAITAYGGQSDASVSDASLRCWARHTSAHFTCRVFEGDHFFVNAARAQVIEDVSARLPR